VPEPHTNIRRLPPLTTEQRELAELYQSRITLLEQLSANLEAKALEALHGLPHVDRISFRVKSGTSFARKCLPSGGDAVYADPLSEVEDQVAGRILVFFEHDLAVVEERLQGWFTGIIEAQKKRPPTAAEFGYESDHYIIVIDEHLKPVGWDEGPTMPATFELQIRTLFMHAYAEPQHDLGYKGADVTDDHRRLLAWVASSAWGADRMFEDTWKALSAPRRA